MQYGEFVDHVINNGGPSDRDAAKQVTQIVMADLGQRLQGAEANDLASQLPTELQGVVTEHEAAPVVTDDVDDFLRRVSDHLGQDVGPEQARGHVQAVFAALSRAVSDGEIKDLRSQLPAGFGPLFE